MVRTCGMDADQIESLWDRWGAGDSWRRIGKDIGVPYHRVQAHLVSVGGVRPDPRKRPSQHLSIEDREEISRGLAAGDSIATIASELDRAPSTIYREIAKNGGRDQYRSNAADEAAQDRLRRPKASKLATNRGLRREVESRLRQDWSPQQISASLRADFPDDRAMWVSHETVYMCLFQPWRKALKPGMRRHLRSGRAIRRPWRSKKPHLQGRIKNLVSIHERPKEVEDKTNPGNWEGDMVSGLRHTSVATLVERTSKLIRIVALNDGIKAEPVKNALVADMLKVPPQLRRTLTWDRGKEMAFHTAFTEATGCPVYFCDPRSPWQRGINENSNGLLRQYLKKDADLSKCTQRQLNAIAHRLNTRPRKILGWRTPLDVYQDLLQDRPYADTVALTP